MSRMPLIAGNWKMHGARSEALALSASLARSVGQERGREIVLAPPFTALEAVGKEIAGGHNKALQVPVKVPVYVAYFTAWPNKDGVVEYFNDVYERDMYMNRAFDATRGARRAEG